MSFWEKRALLLTGSWELFLVSPIPETIDRAGFICNGSQSAASVSHSTTAG